MMKGNEMYFLGIDGGGTKTKFILCDEKLNVRSSTIKESIHHNYTTSMSLYNCIEEGVNDILIESGITKSEILYSFIGIPGYDEDSIKKEQITNTINKVMPNNRYKCKNDVYTAYHGANGTEKGICVSSGTGSIALGLDNDNIYTRVGGWGYFCGDQGSAFWIGKRIIDYFCKESDNKQSDSYLYYRLKELFCKKSDYEIINQFTNGLVVDRRKVASIAPLIDEAFHNGEKEVEKIIDEAAYELCLLVDRILQKSNYSQNEKITVSYNGSVLRSSSTIRNKLNKYINDLDERLVFKDPQFEPGVGACVLAKEYYMKMIKNKGGKSYV